MRNLKHLILPTSVTIIRRGLYYNNHVSSEITILRCPCLNPDQTIVWDNPAQFTSSLLTKDDIVWKSYYFYETLSSDGKSITISPMRNCSSEFSQFNNITFNDLSFSGYKNLEIVVFESGISYISGPCFKDCINLNRVVFPFSIKSFDVDGFTMKYIKNPERGTRRIKADNEMKSFQ